MTRFVRRIVWTAALILGGCTRPEGARLDGLADGLQAQWLQAGHLKMICRARGVGQKVWLHCAVRNTGFQPIAFNKSHLPWIDAITFQVNVLTADGHTPPRPPEPGEIARIGPPAERVVLNPDDSLEGDLELTAEPGRLIRPIGELPRDQELFFLWSCFLQPESAEENGYLSGIAYLAASR